MTAQFDDGKEDGALRTIGEVSRALGIKTHVLRYWEQQFPMLEPLKRSGGRRYYRAEDIQLIERINRLVNDEGYTLKGAQQVIEGGDAETSAPAISAPKKADVETAVTGGGLAESELPTAPDGGVDAFFGREAYAAPELESTPESTPEIVAAAPVLEVGLADEVAGDEGVDEGVDEGEAAMSRAEIIVNLKSIRSRLADALAA